MLGAIFPFVTRARKQAFFSRWNDRFACTCRGLVHEVACKAPAASVLVARLGRAALVEHDAPDASCFAAPDRVEPADDFAVGIADQAGAERQRAGLQDFHAVRFPGEWRGLALEEWRPRREYFFLAVQHAGAVEENRFIGNVACEGRHVAVGHGFGKGAFRGEDLLLW